MFSVYSNHSTVLDYTFSAYVIFLTVLAYTVDTYNINTCPCCSLIFLQISMGTITEPIVSLLPLFGYLTPYLAFFGWSHIWVSKLLKHMVT